MTGRRVAIIGAGIGGLAAAIALSRAGFAVTVFERAATAGGKMREVIVGGARVDAGPTVLTMRWVFDDLFGGASGLDARLTLKPLAILARHGWSDGARLDLHANQAQTADAIGAFAGAGEARGYLAFCAEAKRMYETLRDPFLAASKPNPLTLAARIGPARLGDLMAIRPFDTMWRALSTHFRDSRLRQLFGRYATYCGASPFAAPATLMLIAHVEQEGVWIVDGGMQRLAVALQDVAKSLGVCFHFNAEVSGISVDAGRVRGLSLSTGERVFADSVICNADPAALAAGLFGAAVRRAASPVAMANRSLSAVTWALSARTEGFPLLRHNVFFSNDYRTEFDELRDNRLPTAPTIYICAQDRDDSATASGPEHLLALVNAPARDGAFSSAELDQCETTMFDHLSRCGLTIERATMQAVRTTPTAFNALFPATHGALYGRATHGWRATFQRPGARTRIPGLYLAGGGVHPGAGVPMAALSGQLAAQSVLADRVSTRPSRPAATRGGTSMRSATTNNTP
jgi:1-hydroxycarotenoid 3,4-desaturase